MKEFFQKQLSREWMVFLTATALVAFSRIPAEVWVMVALGFMGFRTWQKMKGQP